MGVKSENDVPKVEEQRKNNQTALENISKRNNTLTEYAETEKSQYRELKDNLSPKELAAVQGERSRIREGGILGVIQKLRDTFGNKYDHDIFKDAEVDISRLLKEESQLRKSIQSQLRHARKQTTYYKHKNYELEK